MGKALEGQEVPQEEVNDLKPYRSQAERTRVRQGYVLIFFGAVALALNSISCAHILGLL